MKGITHFAVGIAAASCFPCAVEAGADGNPLYFILGGVFGILPDTLDFKLYRFFYNHEIYVTCDPLDPDPGIIADGVASAVNMAFVSGKPVRIKLNTIRIGSDQWQSYNIEFDVPGRKVVAKLGPVVDSGGKTVCETDTKSAEARLVCGIRLDYYAVSQVTILDGPTFRMVVDDDGRRVVPEFIPWHRSWSHSVTLGCAWAGLGWLLWDGWAGLIILSAYLLHTVLDQCGFMGSNLYFPFTCRRTDGMMLAHSGDVLWNLSTTWISCLIVFLNLYTHAWWHVQGLTAIRVVFYAAVLPFLMLRFCRKKFPLVFLILILIHDTTS